MSRALLKGRDGRFVVGFPTPRSPEIACSGDPLRFNPRERHMETYDFWTNLFTAYRASPDLIKALWLLIPPCFVLALLLAFLHHRKPVLTQNNSPLLSPSTAETMARWRFIATTTAKLTSPRFCSHSATTPRNYWIMMGMRAGDEQLGLVGEGKNVHFGGG